MFNLFGKIHLSITQFDYLILRKITLTDVHIPTHTTHVSGNSECFAIRKCISKDNANIALAKFILVCCKLFNEQGGWVDLERAEAREYM